MAQIAAIPSTSNAAAQFELPMDAPAAPVSTHAAIGHALGRDFARHGLTPPVEHLHTGSPLLLGWQTGRLAFAKRTLRARTASRLWLMLRTHAWARGRSFEDIRVTPNFLRSIDVSHCPITRLALSESSGQARSVDRVRDDAGYAAGNLAMLSQAANCAKGTRNFVELQAAAQSLAGGPITEMGSLGAAAWQRLAVLTSFVTELPHAQAAALPLLVLPPNRLQIFNPIQALQALLTLEVAQAGWSQRLSRIAALLPTEPCRVDFNRFLMALAPRALEISSLSNKQEVRWALEDAWQQPLLLKRWTRFALHLTATQTEALVQSAAALELCSQHCLQQGSEAALEGWALERNGYCDAVAWH